MLKLEKRGQNEASQKKWGGGGEIEEKMPHFFFLPSPFLFPSFSQAPTLRVAIFTLPFFLHLNIKDGGYNSTNINKQLSPNQNTPALQANPQWYTAGGSEQGFRCCFAGGLNQSLVLSLVQASRFPTSPNLMFMHKISMRMVCINGKHPIWETAQLPIP